MSWFCYLQLKVFSALSFLGQVEPQAQPPAQREPEFQAYIFWAYGLACLLLFVLVAWLVARTKGLEGELSYLKERFEKSHPEQGEALRDGSQ